MSLFYSPENIHAACVMAQSVGMDIDEKHIESSLIMGFTNEYFNDFIEGCLLYHYKMEDEGDSVIGWVFLNPNPAPSNLVKAWSHTNHLYDQFDKMDEGRLN